MFASCGQLQAGKGAVEELVWKCKRNKRNKDKNAGPMIKATKQAKLQVSKRNGRTSFK